MAQPKESKTNRHFRFSLAKSAIRFMGYGCMMAVDVPIIVLAGVLLAGAEVLGILEEI
jgi:thiosulfate reductase cytochrome b subunit